MKPPVAKIVPKKLECHGHERVDDYYWLNDRENPEVIAYLEAENSFTKERTAHTEDLREQIFREIKDRIQQEDETVPYKIGDYLYYRRFEKEKQYTIHCRKKIIDPDTEEILLDVNTVAEGHEYCAVQGFSISYGQNLLAYAVDTVGRRIYTIYVKDLKTGEMLQDEIPEVTGNLAWANDNKTLFYAKHDPVTLRSYRIYRHVLGADVSEDVLVYEEKDETFRTFVSKTKSKKYMLIGSSHSISDEYRVLDAEDPTGELVLIEPRRRDHEYSVNHLGDFFYIVTNDGAKNFKLMRTPVKRPARDHWEEIVPHRDDVLLEDFELFQQGMVLVERRSGLIQLRILPFSGSEEHEIEFDEPAYHVDLGANFELDTDFVRFVYTSLTTPDSVYDYNMRTRERKLLKREAVLGDFDHERYKTERLEATAKDGTKVPISLVYRKSEYRKDGTSPLLLSGYGSYGICRDPTFLSLRLSLLDRGFTVAIAHIRGGEELGRSWYEDGKLLNKKNTFTDFIACAEHLVAEGYTNPKRLYAQGGSAGGLLMGAVMNLRPDLFDGIIAAVPFVDVVTTMLDDSIPLTTFEYDEWGDPRKKEYYDYILSYSPYDNIEAKDYPHLLVTTGLHDSQVQYWEPAKWVAKLRAKKTGEGRLLLKTDLGAGHGGPSGRFKQYRETAFLYAFLLDLAGLASA